MRDRAFRLSVASSETVADNIGLVKMSDLLRTLSSVAAREEKAKSDGETEDERTRFKEAIGK